MPQAHFARRTTSVALGLAWLAAVTISVTSAGCSDSGGASAGGPNGGPGGGSDAGSATADGGEGDAGSGQVGQVDGVQTALPPLPKMSNVFGTENDDSVTIAFDPVDGARDYRVYPLPSDSDITVTPSGAVTVHNATYRCAGDRETPAPQMDNGPSEQSNAVRTLVDNQSVGGFTRTLADATLGYVYTSPGTGLVPVYALGDSDPNADNSCYFARWSASRVKRYTTSASERTSLLASRFRDDGIAFYVPAQADSTTRTIFTEKGDTSVYYFADGPEAAVHAGKVATFPVRAGATAGAVPLMRAYYQNACGTSHDELAVGNERFNRIYKQGDTQPWFGLNWSGITGPTTLVVEALDSGCPFQGHLSPKAIPPTSGHQAFVTIDDVRKASATGEVFINGQHQATNQPKAVARSFLKVSPRAHPTMDWFAGFSSAAAPETYASADCGSPDGNCFQTWRQQSPTFDAMFMTVETDVWAMGSVSGELWVTYADWASDTNGKFRLTAKQKATMNASSFLHVTMEVDTATTGRRYPQILISDQNAPVQYGLVNGKTLVVQTFQDWPNTYELQVCDHRNWDVNDQCPRFDLYHLKSGSQVVALAPNDEVGEHAALDQRVKLDVFTSTTRAYLFMEGKPYGCANLPASGVPSGPVTVTFGDVLYHSGVDSTFKFHQDHLQTETQRHFDNLGFSSGVPAPAWDEQKLPCATGFEP